jgi:ABC-type phosphate/phosphonate transport system permease subunit
LRLPAGFLTIVVETIGFAGGFFAEAMEKTDKGSREAMSVLANPAHEAWRRVGRDSEHSDYQRYFKRL